MEDSAGAGGHLQIKNKRQERNENEKKENRR